MKKLLLCLTPLLVTPVACCAKPKLPSTRSSLTASQTEDSIKETVLRHQILHLGPIFHKGRNVYFLAFQKKDPPAAFMKRFAGKLPEVKLYSEAQYRDGLVKDKSGRDGLLLSIKTLHLIGQNKASVVTSYAPDDQNGDSNEYELARKNGKWMVVDYRLSDVS